MPAVRKASSTRDSRQLTIPIIQVVDTIHLTHDYTGGDAPLVTAFKRAGQYIADHASPKGPDIHLEFAYEGMEFQAKFTAPPTTDTEIDLERMD